MSTPGLRPALPGLNPGPYVLLTVRDNGGGIDLTILDRVFDPFFTTKKLGEGTGMGLSVVHGIVKSHGGEITVNSEPGLGTVFRVYLPRLEREVMAEEKVEVVYRTGNERILFVDDEPELVATWKKILERWGYTVAGMVGSPEALETFQNGPDRFDLVITDQTMPRMGGMELAREFLKIRPALPIILCSGYSAVITPELTRVSGIRKFLLKPVTPIEMATTIRRVLEIKNGQHTDY